MEGLRSGATRAEVSLAESGIGYNEEMKNKSNIIVRFNTEKLMVKLYDLVWMLKRYSILEFLE